MVKAASVSEQKANATTQCGRGDVRRRVIVGSTKALAEDLTHTHARERVYLHPETSARRATASVGMKRDRESREYCKEWERRR